MTASFEKDLFYRAYETQIRGSIPLMMYYAWRWSKKTDAPSLPNILDRYIDLWHKTIYYENTIPSEMEFSHPVWTDIRSNICTFYEHYGQENNSRDFENSCLEYLWPFMEPRIFDDSRPLRKNKTRPYGAWTVTFRENNVMSVHIANIYRPDSVFDHPMDFAADLLYLIYDTCDQHPNLQTLFCGSWLNNLPPFQKFFPPEWVINLHRPVYHNDTHGIWGQYITRTGGFHIKNAASLRERGFHRYPLIHGQCSLPSAITYLESEGWRTPR
ncbi:MAG: hypothetical protein KAH38_04715 [Candidatus Hydrogenedentes bacterium]|nr:hypothetical protein [Candidatus Hydrogenedentota bacterium]